MEALNKLMSGHSCLRLLSLVWLLAILGGGSAGAILAGGEFDVPEDRPSLRLDPFGRASPLNFVGALEMFAENSSYRGSAVALSPSWVLTAGHNVDLNDDGAADDALTVNFHLPGFGDYTSTGALTHPSFNGFGNPSVHHDLALLHFNDPLPQDLMYPALGLSMGIGDIATLVGFGRSGFGSYGYTTGASLTDRRIGYNTIAFFEPQTGGNGLLFRYDFDAPGTAASLGNGLETIIGPGDSGGPALFPYDERFALLGINTFSEGYGGRFGDIGGGVVLDPYWRWISETTGLALVPEPATAAGTLGLFALFVAVFGRRKRGAGRDGTALRLCGSAILALLSRRKLPLFEEQLNTVPFRSDLSSSSFRMGDFPIALFERSESGIARQENRPCVHCSRVPPALQIRRNRRGETASFC